MKLFRRKPVAQTPPTKRPVGLDRTNLSNFPRQITGGATLNAWQSVSVTVYVSHR